MTDSSFDATPQFSKAEYIGEAGTDRCSFCRQPIAGSYYRVSEAMTCPTCAAAAHSASPRDTHAAFVRALLFGAGGAILGLILYSAFGIITGLVIGYLSLGVGYVVGKAMMYGSKGIGGRRYQIAAVGFTYAAVALSAIPMGIAYMSKHPESRGTSQSEKRANSDQPRAQLDQEQRQLEQEFGKNPPAPSNSPAVESSDTSNKQSATNPAEQRPKTSIGKAIGMMALYGLASPFIELQDPLHGVIGLVILLVGIRIAWQLTGAKRPEITGPFQNTPAT